MPKLSLLEQLAASETANIELARKLLSVEGVCIDTNKRIRDIAAENESLRMDKKWLQQIIQRMIEMRLHPTSISESMRNALPR